MAFGNIWVETDPDGSIITVSQLDNSDRLIKQAVRERLEGDPAAPDLTGLIEVGSFPAAPKPRKGAARVYVDTQANILAYGATKREDGRLAVASDTGRLFHVATAAVAPVKYDAADVTVGTLSVTRGGTGVSNPTAGNLLVGAGAGAMTFLAPGAAGGYVRSDGVTWSRTALILSDGTGAIPFAGLPNGGGTWLSTTSLIIDTQLTANHFTVTESGIDKFRVTRLGGGIDDCCILVRDETAGALKRVSRGVVDSGGAGFRLLRIPN